MCESVKLDYGSAHPCSCGSRNLRVKHSFGAQVICNECDFHGNWVNGNEYQREEQYAIWAWNDQMKELQTKEVGLSLQGEPKVTVYEDNLPDDYEVN